MGGPDGVLHDRFLLSRAAAVREPMEVTLSWLFLYSQQTFLPPRGRPSSVPGVMLQCYEANEFAYKSERKN